MTVNKRYKGCRVCGVTHVQCTECSSAADLVAAHGYANVSLVVDGSFHRIANTIRGVTFQASIGYGGAGLVLVRGGIDGEHLASRACGFLSSGSGDAELQAVIRGARWARGVTIYTDSDGTQNSALRMNRDLRVVYVPERERSAAFMLAHQLSIEGRVRDMPVTPETASAIITTSLRRTATSTSNKSRKHRMLLGVDILLEHAEADPAFDGDFTELATRLGWKLGNRWHTSPVRVALARGSPRSMAVWST